MMVGKAARTMGLLAVKLPVSSNSRKTSTMLVMPPVLGSRDADGLGIGLPSRE